MDYGFTPAGQYWWIEEHTTGERHRIKEWSDWHQRADGSRFIMVKLWDEGESCLVAPDDGHLYTDATLVPMIEHGALTGVAYMEPGTNLAGG